MDHSFSDSRPLNSKLETLTKLATEQLKRIEQAESHLREAEGRVSLQSEEEARLQTARINLEESEAEARRQKAQAERAHTEAEARARTAEEEKQLAQLEEIRASAELEIRQMAEVKQQLTAGIEVLRKAAAVQVKQIEDAEVETRERTQQEECRLAELEARRVAADELRQRLEVETRERATEETQRLADLEAIRSNAEAEAQIRAEEEQQLNAGLEALRKAEALQLQRMQQTQAESQRLAEEEARLRVEEEALRQEQAEARRLAAVEQLGAEEALAQQQASEDEQQVSQLAAIHRAAEAAAQQRAETLQRLNEAIETIRQTELEQANQIREAEARLRDAEAESQQQAEAACRLKAEEEARRQTNEEARRVNFQAGLARAEEEERRVAHEEEKRLTVLETLRSQAANRSQQRLEREEQLAADIAALAAIEAEQVKRVEDAERALIARAEARQAAEVEASKRIAAAEQQLAELEAIRNDLEEQLQLKAAATKDLKVEVELLRKAEAKKLKVVEKLEARRLKAQAEALLHAEQETQLLAELESIRERVELNEQSWPDKELTIKAQIAALRKAETIQLKRLEKIEARLHDQEAATRQVKTKTARATKSRKANAKATANTEAGQLTEKDRIALLEAILSATELDLEQHSTKEQQLHTRIQALFGQEIEQLQRIEEAKARLRAHESVLQMRVDDEPRFLSETVPPVTEAVDIQATTETQTLPPSVEIHGTNFENGAENQLQVESGEPELSPAIESTYTDVFAPQLSISGLQETEWPVDAIANDSAEPKVPEFEIELSEFDFQSELANFEGNSSSFVGQPDEQVEAKSAEDVDLISDDWVASPLAESSELPASIEANAHEKSIDPVETEKSIQPSSEAISTSELVEALTSGDAAKRAVSLEELAELDDDYAFGLITDLFDDSSAEVRNEAARALHEFKPDHATSFTRALREASIERRRNIAAALNGSGLAAEAIQNLLGESREKTYDAFSLLFLMAKAGEIRPLLLTIEKHPDVAVRLSVIRLLTFSNQPDIIPAFRSLAVRASLPTEVRSAVMEAIYEISNNARENSRSVA